MASRETVLTGLPGRMSAGREGAGDHAEISNLSTWGNGGIITKIQKKQDGEKERQQGEETRS